MPRRDETRLVYSTGGPVPDEKPRGKAPAPASRPAPAKGQIRIWLDRRAGNRVATVVTGLPGTEAEVTALARSLKLACGTGGTFKDGTLELQGDHRTKVESVLAAAGLKSKRAGG